MIYFIIVFLIVIAASLSVLSVIFAYKDKKKKLLEAKELEAFTAENGTSNKGESMDEVEVLTFYSPNVLGLY